MTSKRYPQRKPRNTREKVPRTSLMNRLYLSVIYMGLIIGILVLGILFYLSRDLPNLDELNNPKYDLPTQLFDRNNNLITEFYSKRRVLVPFEKVPDIMVKALIAIEDNRFYDHFGIDPIRIIRALIVDIIRGSWAQGASTLTQQTAKNFLLTSDKKIIRKLKEILLALKIESRFHKNQILELYLNKSYFGNGAWGIEAAAQGYFSKNTEELTLPEAAMLAGVLPAPSRYDPTNSIENATRRRNLVLRSMEQAGYITREERLETSAEPIKLNLNKSLDYNETSYYVEHVRKYLYKKYGKDQLYRGGLKVYTMMDLKEQISAQTALYQGLKAHDKRQGYRGPIKNLLKEVDQELNLFIFDNERGWNKGAFKRLDEETKSVAKLLYRDKKEEIISKNHFLIGGKVLGVVTEVGSTLAKVDLGKHEGNLLIDSIKWARPVNYEVPFFKERLDNLKTILKIGDVIELELLDYNQDIQEFALALSQKPIANGGLFVMDPKNGHVLAMSGGYDFKESEFNRAIQGRRQTGSAFKPIVYSLALDSSFTASSMLDDTPFVDGDNNEYKPGNYSKSFKGKMSLREALVHSRNMPSLRLMKELGWEPVIQHARKFGITTDFPKDDLTIVLGSASLTLLEMVRAFAIFANGGHLVQPVYISRIEDRDGNILEEYHEIEPDQVLSEETSFLMTSILQDVVRRGSGWRARGINRPSAGKTGTTNNYTDAWYIGYIPQLISGVYIGFDIGQRTLGENETGSRAAAPIWVDFMKEATASMPILPFHQPDGINMVKINVDSGLLDCGTSSHSMFEYYKAGTEPTQCHQETGSTFDDSAGSSKDIDPSDETGKPTSGETGGMDEEL